MRSVARLLVLAFLLGEAMVTSVAHTEPCSGECSDDMPDGSCPLGCHECVCSPVWLGLTPLPTPTQWIQQAVRIPLGEAEQARPAPPSREILHVPKRAAA